MVHPSSEGRSRSYGQVDPEWDDRAFGLLVRLMKKKVQAEEDAKKREEELRKDNCELREIKNELKTVRQQLQKATAKLKSFGNYRKLAHVLLALFVVVAGLMLGGKAN
ncbi:hypothetical protein SETIT_3G242600v2 [Setaria italica]|uniref:Uncharacterized protein n=1 Tax=Setaria italica TaxID=4555 RepID=A0A368QIC0_SETIT|nr:hypothetical protein SETIT_3G242600v2 [Setaria italica]